jgi:hypothetical protein
VAAISHGPLSPKQATFAGFFLLSQGGSSGQGTDQ